ncbi:MAG: stage III sporulation protein AB [Lachnospiraceae bacterium]|nr:stage III sporulation protein AB [Lachnospiraceae bacterium]
MLQLTGCLMIIAGCMGVAAVVCRDYNSRLYLLKQIREIYENLKYYITYQKMTIPEAMLRLSEKERDPFSTVFHEIYEENRLRNGNFPDIWKKHIGKMLSGYVLRDAEKKLLLDFPSCLGYMEEGAQAGALDELQREVIRCIEELSGEQKNKNKMVMSLGLAGGVLLSILLL